MKRKRGGDRAFPVQTAAHRLYHDTSTTNVTGTTVNTTATRTHFFGCGDIACAQSLYETAILQECAAMRRDGVYVCLANLQARMPSYTASILLDAFWNLARNGAL